MPAIATILKVLIASPNDVAGTRGAAMETIIEWNGTNSDILGVFLQPVMWETDSTPEFGDRPQGLLNNQIVKVSDIVVAIFHSRIGSPTGEAESGTAEEIEQFVELGRPALVYFSEAPLPADVDTEQLSRLRDFKGKLRRNGIVEEFSTDDEFRRKLDRHITRTVTKYLSSGAFNISEDNEVRPRASNLDLIRTVRREIDESPFEKLDSALSRIDEARRTFQVQWALEQASEPPNLEGGKRLLDELEPELAGIRVQPEVDKIGLLANGLDRAILKIKTLRQAQLYIDGGRSYREFWRGGRILADRLESIYRALENIVKSKIEPTNPDGIRFFQEQKACIVLGVGPRRGFGHSTSRDFVRVEIPIRNDGDALARDVEMEVWSIRDEPKLIGRDAISSVGPGANASLGFQLPRPPITDPPTPEDHELRIVVKYRDRLGSDTSVFEVNCGGVFGADFQCAIVEDNVSGSLWCVFD